MSLKEVIEFDSEEAHSFLFKIQVEGNDIAPARVRLVCEGDDMSYMFNGHSSGQEGIVEFTIPVMKGKITEGAKPARVEVLIDNKYFAPVQFDINFKQPIKVFAEAVNAPVLMHKKSEVKVTASPISQQRIVESQPRPLVIEAIPSPPMAKPVLTVPETQKDDNNLLLEPEAPAPLRPTQQKLPNPSFQVETPLLVPPPGSVPKTSPEAAPETISTSDEESIDIEPEPVTTGTAGLRAESKSLKDRYLRRKGVS